MIVPKIGINDTYSTKFGMNYKPSKDFIKLIEKSTGLTYDELTRLSLDEAELLMKQRGTLKEPSKIKTWLSNTYRKIGETLGLLDKEYNFYTHVD